MPLVNAKCPNCGATLTVDKEKDCAICEHCGSPFIIEKAINNYNTTNVYNGNVVIESSDSVDVITQKAKLDLYRYENEKSEKTLQNIEKYGVDLTAIDKESFYGNYCLLFSCWNFKKHDCIGFEEIDSFVASLISKAVLAAKDDEDIDILSKFFGKYFKSVRCNEKFYEILNSNVSLLQRVFSMLAVSALNEKFISYDIAFGVYQALINLCEKMNFTNVGYYAELIKLSKKAKNGKNFPLWLLLGAGIIIVAAVIALIVIICANS